MTLVEVLTSAILLVVVSLGVTKGIDTASNVSGSSKLKTTASMLAAADQERMRAFTSANLSRYNGTRTKAVRGTTFTIVSQSRWISDGSGTESCAELGAAGDDQASYMRITSTVTWPKMHGQRPVVATSLVAPPNGSFGEQGSLLVEIVDREGVGIPGIDVRVAPLSGTGGPLTERTGARGCAFFGFLAPINYRATFERTDYVTPQGAQAVSQDIGVVPAATNRVSIQYDRAATLNVDVVTRRPGDTGDRAATAEHLTVGHSGLATPGTRLFNVSGSPPYSLARLFPFTSNYVVYSGNCPGARPSASGGSDVFQSPPAGGFANATVREIGVGFRYGSNTSINRARFTAKSAGCSLIASLDIAATAGTYRYLSGDSALPYGLYDVCVRRGNAGSYTYRLLSNRLLSEPAGHEIDVQATTGWTSGACSV